MLASFGVARMVPIPSVKRFRPWYSFTRRVCAWGVFLVPLGTCIVLGWWVRACTRCTQCYEHVCYGSPCIHASLVVGVRMHVCLWCAEGLARCSGYMRNPPQARNYHVVHWVGVSRQHGILRQHRGSPCATASGQWWEMGETGALLFRACVSRTSLPRVFQVSAPLHVHDAQGELHAGECCAAGVCCLGGILVVFSEMWLRERVCGGAWKEVVRRGWLKWIMDAEQLAHAW